MQFQMQLACVLSFHFLSNLIAKKQTTKGIDNARVPGETRGLSTRVLLGLSGAKYEEISVFFHEKASKSLLLVHSSLPAMGKRRFNCGAAGACAQPPARPPAQGDRD
jgi:hypothetical protein